MMTRGVFVLAVLSSSILVAAAPVRQAHPRLEQAREALGGKRALQRVTSLLLQGTRQAISFRLGALDVPRALEVRVLLPDNYLRIDTDPMMWRFAGFRRDLLLNRWKPFSPDARMSPPSIEGQLEVERAAFARFALGLLAETRTALPLEVHATRSDRAGESLDFTGPGGFAATLDLGPTSHLPVRVRYEGRERFPRAGGVTQTGGTRVSVMPPAETAEVTLSFEDRRLIEGVRLPYRVTRSARSMTLEDIRFEKVVVNPPLAAKDFQP